MTVNELIKELQSMDPYSTISIPCPTGGRMEATYVVEEDGKAILA
jgi:hypothetical protein